MKRKFVWGIAGIFALTFLLFLTKAQTAPLVPQRGSDTHDQLMGLINQARAENGLPPLKRNDLLNTSADSHSQNMAQRDFAAHCDPDTHSSPRDRMMAAGYLPDYSGENIGWGFTNATSVFEWWRNSPVHWASILSPNYREIGIGYFLQGNDQPGVRLDSNNDCIVDGATSFAPFRYWTLNFGTQNDVFPLIIENEAPLVEDRNVSLFSYGVGWAQEMRLQNEGGAWSAWQPFLQEISWLLSADTGEKLVRIELRNGNEIRVANDTIFLKDLSGPTVTPQFDYLPLLVNQFDASQVTPPPTATPTQLPTSTPTPTATLTPSPTATATELPPQTTVVTLTVQKTDLDTSVYQIANESDGLATVGYNFYEGNEPTGTPLYTFFDTLNPLASRVYDLADVPIPAGFVGVVEAVADQSISGQTWFGLQRGDVDGQDLVFASLPAFFVARYQYEVASSDVITVNIAAELHMDMMVALVDENDDVLTLQNLQPPGEAEILLNFSLPISGTYDIWVFEVGGNAGNFSLILQGQYDYEFVFKGTLAVPETTTNVLPAQQDDFWHFAGTVSQTITITVTPNDGSDLFFELYSTEGKIGDTVDDNGNGSSEQMVYVLPPTGFFAIRLGEFDFLPASYTIAVE